MPSWRYPASRRTDMPPKGARPPRCRLRRRCRHSPRGGADARSGRRAGVSRTVAVASANRPGRARRQRRTRARSFANGGVACLMHTAVATSLTPFGDRRQHGRDCPALVVAHGAERVPRIRGARPVLSCSDAHSRCGACPRKGILGRISGAGPLRTGRPSPAHILGAVLRGARGRTAPGRVARCRWSAALEAALIWSLEGRVRPR
jgi:hypothetical protein